MVRLNFNIKVTFYSLLRFINIEKTIWFSSKIIILFFTNTELTSNHPPFVFDRKIIYTKMATV